MKEIGGYGWEMYYGGTYITQSGEDDVFETEEEAMEDAVEAIDAKIEQWETDGGWNKDDSRDLFSVVITETWIEEEED